jgi:4a-hydroxytetrahydrobiopterin dehydratase
MSSSSTKSLLTPEETAVELDERAFLHLDGALYAFYRTPDFASANRLVQRVAEVAEEMNHHPDVQLGYGTVGFTLSSHDAGGVTARDVRLAVRIQQLAESLGATPQPASLGRYEVAIDSVDADAIRPFWRAGMGYVDAPGGDGDLVDPLGRGPRVWFQHMEIARTDRNRIHLDVYVPTADAEARVQSVVEAGGTVLTDEHAPDWWVLADVDGNELCVCTSAV